MGPSPRRPRSRSRPTPSSPSGPISPRRKSPRSASSCSVKRRSAGSVSSRSTFFESQQKLEVLEAYTEKEDGRRIAVEPANIFTRDAASGAALVLQRDFKSTTIIFPDMAVGDSLVFTYRLTTRGGVLGRHVDDVHVFPRRIPLAPSTLRVVAPRSAGLKIAVIGDGLAHRTQETTESVSHVVNYAPPPRDAGEAGDNSLLDRDPP